VKIFTGVVIDEDSKQAYTDNTSYDIIGFALLNLDDLTISYVTKDCVSDKLKQDSSIVYYPPKEFNRYIKYIVPKDIPRDGRYLLVYTEDDVELEEIKTSIKSLPIYTKKLSLFTVIGAEAIRFGLNPCGSLVYNCVNNTLDAYIDSGRNRYNRVGYLSDSSHRIVIKDTENIFHSPFDNAYVFGDCCWVVSAHIKSAVIPETVKELAIYSCKISELVLPKSVEYISMDRFCSVDTYYISKDAKISLVCLLIYGIAGEYRGDGESTYFLLEEELEPFIYKGDYEKIWEIFHEERYKEYLDMALRDLKIIVY
jgi:hypothetical protein